MSIQVLQKPSDIQPSQSPIVFSVLENTASFVTASEFQYTANLYVWQGGPTDSGSYIYQTRKYPNQSGSGIFDFSRIINSTFTKLAAEPGSPLPFVKYYKVEFGWQYESGSTYVTQSGGLTPVTCSTGGTMFKAYDGYNTFTNANNATLFPAGINASLFTQTRFTGWPVMSDMTTVTQSVTLTDRTFIGSVPNTRKGLPIWVGQNDNTYPSFVAVTASYTDGTTTVSVPRSVLTTGSTNTNLQVFSAFATAPGDQGFNAFWNINTGKTLDKYVMNVYSGSSALMSSSHFKVDCVYYYVPIRVAFKNRFGQFDFFNFYKRNNQTFNTEQRLYQPQLGTWNSSTLSYNSFQTRAQRYIVDATEVLECNTDFIEQGYNEIFKQLLVSDEIYWIKGPIRGTPPPTNLTDVSPLTIQTNSLQFKTGINNKLIQYTITFDIGQPYKLIL